MSSELHWVIHKSQDNQFYFTQVAGNNEVLTTSETYHYLNDAIDGAVVSGAEKEKIEYDFQG